MYIYCVHTLYIFFKVISTHNMGLKLTIPISSQKPHQRSQTGAPKINVTLKV